MRARIIPERDDKEWMKHTAIWVDEKGKTRIDYRPVQAAADDATTCSRSRRKARVY